MDRCALFVDAPYVLATGAMAAYGTRQREAVTWDHGGLVGLLNTFAVEHTGLPSLRCYWYDTTDGGDAAPEHDALAEIAGVKLRLDTAPSGRRRGVGLMVYRDLTLLAREHAICDAVLVSGDEETVDAVAEAQDRGVRVTVLHVPVDGGWTVPAQLRRECDALVEIAATQLQPRASLHGQQDLAASSQRNGQTHTALLAEERTSRARHRANDYPDRPSGSSAPRSFPRSGGEESSGDGSLPAATPAHPGGGDVPAEPGRGGQHGPEDRRLEEQRSSGDVHRDRGGQGAQESSRPTSSSPAVSDAVRRAHREGLDFGDSVARDAPALWLEAVLARRPRIPSDLEARLLQGSALSRDFLLQDEVRRALREGFWEGVEQPER